MTRTGSLFSGNGGLDHGLRQVLGGEVAWHCDPDPAAAAVLAHHHPQTPNLGDITRVGLPHTDQEWTALRTRAAADPGVELPVPDWSGVDPIDVLCGGFPCQDVSTAGRRCGLAPGTRSGLWTYMAHAIAQLRPRLVVIENVRGLLTAPAHRDVEPGPDVLGDRPGRLVLRAAGAVLGTLAQLGYDARWRGLPASDAGAPHARYRVFIVAAPAADADHIGRQRPRQAWHRWNGPTHGGLSAADTHRPRQQGPQPAQGPHLPARGADRWGTYAAAIARWEHVLGRVAPDPTEPGRGGNLVLSPRFVEWLMGLPAGHVTAVPGLTRAAQLRLLGNGVVPHQAALAVRTLLDLDHPEAVST